MLCARVCEGDAAACGGVDGGDGEVWGGEAYDVMAKGVGGKYWILRVHVRGDDLGEVLWGAHEGNFAFALIRFLVGGVKFSACDRRVCGDFVSRLWYIFGWVLDLSIFQASRVCSVGQYTVVFLSDHDDLVTRSESVRKPRSVRVLVS